MTQNVNNLDVSGPEPRIFATRALLASIDCSGSTECNDYGDDAEDDAEAGQGLLMSDELGIIQSNGPVALSASPVSWEDRLKAIDVASPITVDAVSFIRWMGHSFSSPAQLKCSDGFSYIVKSPSDGLATSTEQIVARLANIIDAPVPEGRLVRISQRLLDENVATMAKYTPGLCHGLRFVPNCSDKIATVSHQDLPANRSRFSSLAVLYGWFHLGSDYQFFYDIDTQEVYSFDHRFFFPSGPNWSEATLAGHHAISMDSIISAACNFSDDEDRSARSTLDVVTEDHIASAVMSPPTEWPVITPAMRLKAAEYLMTRCVTLRS